MRLIFVGPPASGKGTQAKLIAAKLAVPHISTGDMLREAIRARTPVGQKAEDMMKSGNLVPDDIVIGIIEERFARPDCATGYLLDGFPRTLRQAEALSRLSERLGLPVQAVVHIDVPDAVCVERITGRRGCPKCNAGYHLTFIPPQKAGVCDFCGTALIQRADDTETAARARLLRYHAETAAVLPFYAKIIRKVDGNRPPGAVTQAIERALQPGAP